jgi:putative radical SAM enzyme (TIGR03279 family)
MSMNTELPVYKALPMADERVVAPRRTERAMVLGVRADSAADEAGVHVGDILIAINQFPVLDIVDYQFHTAGEHVVIDVRRCDETLSFTLEKGYDEDLGLEFADDLFDRVHICKNKCVFCFLYQQPKGLRSSLYIKDDDYRLSFLHGNYLTLTNMTEGDFDRIIEQKLSPLFVSVHATDPEVRGRMLGRKLPEPILPRLTQLADAGIQIHGQVVLCPGYNDGEVLAQTVDDLAALHPERRGTYGGVLSVAVVPVGLTQFRDRLAALTTCSRPFCAALVAQALEWRSQYRAALETNFVFLSDEIYLTAGVETPSTNDYEGFPQLEDGVGLVRQFLDDHAKLAKRRPAVLKPAKSATLITGELASTMVTGLAGTLSRLGGGAVNVATVHNTFFEGNISVAGLLTGQDIAAHLKAMGSDVGDRVIVPSIMLRDPDRDVFLDDMGLDEFSALIGRELVVVDRMPSAAARAVLA